MIPKHARYADVCTSNVLAGCDECARFLFCSSGADINDGMAAYTPSRVLLLREHVNETILVFVNIDEHIIGRNLRL